MEHEDEGQVSTAFTTRVTAFVVGLVGGLTLVAIASVPLWWLT